MSEVIAQYQMRPSDGLILSIVVLFVGLFLNRRVRLLRENFIPPAVTGGIICSAITAVIFFTADLEISFDLQIRDVLLLVFFSTIGLSAKLKTLLPGGKALAILVGAAAIFLIFQDAMGVSIALLFGAHPGYGLMAGSVSLAGGHGTAIAWGDQAEAAGLVGAGELGIAFATFGLVAGGVLGGPIARRLLEKNNLSGPKAEVNGSETTSNADDGGAGELYAILTAILILTVCVAIGDSVNRFLFDKDVLLPGFLTAMFVGIFITNAADMLRLRFNAVTVDKFGEVALNLFLAMSLMSMQLWVLAGAVGPILIALLLQMLVIALFATFVVFRVMGRDYDAAVMSAGFVGLGLGATPVAIANMDSITLRYGPSAKAFLVVPLVGAFFIDVLNAGTIKFFINVISKWLI